MEAEDEALDKGVGHFDLEGRYVVSGVQSGSEENGLVTASIIELAANFQGVIVGQIKAQIVDEPNDLESDWQRLCEGNLNAAFCVLCRWLLVE